jgi:UDP-N-acetylmuramate--alanine ligase
VVTYGISRQASVRADRVLQDGLAMQFDVLHEGRRLGSVDLAVPGAHNVLNALAAVAVGLELDIPFERIRAGLGRFSGVQRRLHTIGEAGGILVVDDYAHHPTEIRATLQTAARSWPDRRIVAVFQPHLYSRTRDFLDEFARAFFDADVVFVTDVYAAREAEMDGVNGGQVAERARTFGHRAAHYEPDREALPALVARMAQPGDLVITLGAGDIWRFSRALLRELGAETGEEA